MSERRIKYKTDIVPLLTVNGEYIGYKYDGKDPVKYQHTQQ